MFRWPTAESAATWDSVSANLTVYCPRRFYGRERDGLHKRAQEIAPLFLLATDGRGRVHFELKQKSNVDH